MIVATAGHVDHGKTSLLKALTGVDADRLPEEKKRGLTIDLGFVYDDRLCPGRTIGFVDVPGHERFIHNMLAGVTAIRAAMLVVAADDGPMPQTREHLDILDLVGVTNGFVALTKIDRVDAARVDDVVSEVAGLLAGTSLAGAEVLPVSSTTGEGVSAVAARLAALAETEAAQPRGNFRLPVDRVFTVAGAGLVATGLVRSGRIAVGDMVRVLPGDLDLRVRGLRVQDRPAEAAVEGDRCAINLAGTVRKEDIARGDWIVAGPAPDASRRLDASIRVLPSEARPLKHWTPVHVHVGTADVTGRVALLEGDAISPGARGLVQLVLDHPVHACAGDVAVLRDQSARRTLGGGPIVDPASPARGRARPERLGWVRALAREERRAAIADILTAHPGGAPLHAARAAWNLTDDEAETLFDGAILCREGAEIVGLTEAHWNTLQQDILTALEEWHRSRPDGGGANDAALARNLPRKVQPVAYRAALAALAGQGEIRRAGAMLHRRGFEPRLSDADEKLWHQVRALMAGADEKPPTVFELSESTGVEQKAVGALLGRAAKLGRVLRVSDNRYMTMDRLRELGEIAERGAATVPGGRFTAANYRDWSGMGRNLSIEILEFFDKMKLTRRMGNERELVGSAAALFAAGTDEAA